jgi:hypothetical protein
MGNTPIAPREQHNMETIPEVTSSQDDHVSSEMTRTNSSSQEDHVSEMTRTNSVNANANELGSTQNETSMYLPKGFNRSNNSVIMPSRPYGSGGPSIAGGGESPQWGWYINIKSPTTEMYHSGSRPPLHKVEDSSANASQASTRYLPKTMNRSNNSVSMPSKPYGCGGASTAGGIESPQWGWSISATPPASDMYHCGNRPPSRQQDTSTNTRPVSSGTVISESSKATSHQPNRIFRDMQKGASLGWSSVPL